MYEEADTLVERLTKLAGNATAEPPAADTGESGAIGDVAPVRSSCPSTGAVVPFDGGASTPALAQASRLG